jgi:hypothetical protein
MIKSVKIKDGVLKKLIGKKEIKFNPGINVIWGRNGVGKSLLLKTIGSYCFVDQTGGGGWSQSQIFFRWDRKWDTDYKKINMSDVYEFNKDSKIDIDWDGIASFYMHHDDMIDDTHIIGYEMNGSKWINGIGKIMDNVVRKNNYHPSSGQQIKGITEMLLNVECPDLLDEKYLRSNNCYDFKFYIEKRREFFKGESKPTLLLDELDSQLDLFNQIWFHEEVIPKLLEKFQIILVSHSIFATKYENIIDLDGSLNIVKQKIKTL